MICFRDRSWCSSDCVNRKCSRNFGPEEKAAAKRWWEGCKGQPPVAFMDFKTGCEDYLPPKERGAK